MKTGKTKFISVLLLTLIAMVGCVFVACDKGPETPSYTEGPEVGVYYYTAESDEYTFALTGNNKFTLSIDGVTKGGSYTLSGANITFDFDNEAYADITGTLANDVITVTDNGTSMRYLKKINYTVSFNANGGSAVEDVTVVNGKTVAKPADPTRDGYIFVGWYADAEFTTPYVFDAQVVSGNVTLYAQWSEVPAGAVSEYVVDFDLGYDGEEVAALNTVGGKIFDLPTVTRDGYTFKGWWISQTENADELSYKYEDGMVFTAHTTLFALWESASASAKLNAPVVNVENGAVRWDAVAGAMAYDVEIVDANGNVVVSEKSIPQTVVNVPFSTYNAGNYVITVTAIANTGAENNSVAVRYYKNKALNRVSLFEVVEPSMLVFTGVENAEKYIVTVKCGNASHNHVQYDNGTSTTFNFFNCDMKEGGIEFVVTAVADGYASSVSETFTYERVLAGVGALKFDEANQVVSWNAVPVASGYMVSVTEQGAEDNFVDVGNVTSISLKEYAAGNLVVKVYPKAKGFNSPAAEEYTFVKNTLATPANIVVLGTTISWTAVENADSYEVKVGDATYTAETATFTLPADVELVEGATYAISVRAIGTTQSSWSDEVVANYYVMSEKLTYAKSVLSWKPVFGATGYEVQVNDGEIVAVADNNAEIELTKEGANALKVRFVDGGYKSEWTEMTVVAYEIVFDSVGGSVADVQYKAVGDAIALPTPEKSGYEFTNWYNTPANNGSVYADNYFTEAGSIVLYAHYAPKTYTVTYNLGNLGTSDKTSDSVVFNNKFALAVPTAKDATMVFGGWYSEPDGKGVQYTDAKGNSVANWDVADNAELHAYWVTNVLKYSKTKFNGNDVYAVSQGDRISYVNEITVPAYYNGLPVAIVSGNAFKDASNLVAINLPNTVQSISTIDTFSGCNSLANINIYEVEGNSVVVYTSIDGVVFQQETNTAGGVSLKLAFMPVGKTGTYNVPANVTEIPARAFAACSLETVVIPASVTRINVEAFLNSKALTTVIFEDEAGASALTIDSRAFSGCTALTTVKLPARLSNIELNKYTLSAATGTPAINEVNVADATDAFSGCTALTNVEFAKGNANYKIVDGVIYSADGSELLYCLVSKSGEFTVPAGTASIANGAFLGCTALTSVIIPDGVTSVGECAFYGCTGLTSVKFEESFNPVTINRYAFRGCSNLVKVEYEAGAQIATIGQGAFVDCTSLATVDIVASVTYIGNQAFRGCKAVTAVNFAASANELKFGADVFYDCIKIASVELPDNVSEIPGIFSGCISLESVSVTENNPYFTSEEGVLFSKDGTQLLYFPQGKSGEYTIPDGVTYIANGVFRGTNLTKVTIPATVTEIGTDAFRDTSSLSEVVFTGEPAEGSKLFIGGYAFNGSAVANITLPAHTHTIGEYAFSNVSAYPLNLTMNEGLEIIGKRAFYYTNYQNIVIPSTVVEICDEAFYDLNNWNCNISIAEGSQLKTIGNRAFYDAKMYTFVLPASVETIGDEAFYYCNSLEEFTIEEGSVLKTIGTRAFYNAGTTSWDNTTYTSVATVSIVVPKTVTTIKAGAFEGSYIKSVKFEEGGTEDLVLGAPGYILEWDYTVSQDVEKLYTGNVFTNSSYLTEVVFPERLVDLGEYAFNGAGSQIYSSEHNRNIATLSITFAENSKITTIAPHAFDSAKVNEIVIPNSVKNLPYVLNDATGEGYDRLAIGEGAFKNLIYTETITIQDGGEGQITIGKDAFIIDSDFNTGNRPDINAVINLPSNMAPYDSYTGETIAPIANGAGAFIQKEFLDYNVSKNHFNEHLTAINVAEGCAYLASVDGVLYNADKTELIFCPTGYNKTSKVMVDEVETDVVVVNVPNTVTKIADQAFLNCTKVASIEIAVGAEELTIGDRAFYDCTSLTTIALPSNVIAIGEQAFYGCSNLTSFKISKNLTSFSAAMIEGCTSITEIIVEEGNTAFKSVNGVLFNADMTELVFYPAKKAGESYEIPETVTAIGAGAFKLAENLTSVTFPAGLKTIGDNAFYGVSLNNVVIPNTVEVIGNSAFEGIRNYSSSSSYNYLAVTGLTFEEGGDADLVIGDKAFMYLDANSVEDSALEIPARVVSIGTDAFRNSLVDALTFEEGAELEFIGDGAFAYSMFETLTVPSVKILGIRNTTSGSTTGVFANNMKLKTVVFEEGTEWLGDRTFSACTALESVAFPASLKSMGELTFSTPSVYSNLCSNLKKVTFAPGSQLESIGVGTFAGSGIESITIPASVTRIEDANYYSTTMDTNHPGAFYQCKKLEAIIFENGSKLEYIGKAAFSNCTSLKYFTIPAAVSFIGEEAFRDCNSFESFTLPATVTSFGYNVFYSTGNSALSNINLETVTTELPFGMFQGLKNLKTIEIPETVSKIGSYCFAESGIERIIIPETVTYIDANAFIRCTDLKYVEIRGKIDTLYYGTFSGCTALETVILPDTLKTIEDSVFRDCTSLTSFEVPVGVNSINFNAFINSGLEEFTVANGNTEFKAVDGVLLNGDGSKIMVYPAAKPETTYVIPNTVVEISERLFNNNKTIEEIIFEEGGDEFGVTIGAYAFNGCSNLKKVVMTDRVIGLGEGAFTSCSSLATVVMSNSIEEIPAYAFSYCNKLVKINLPNSLISIGENAFQNCSSLVTITIPASVKNIYTPEGTSYYLYGYAFNNCSKLMEVVNHSSLPIVQGADTFGRVAKYATIVTDGESTIAADENGFLTQKVGDEIVLIGYSGNATELVIPEGITQIADQTFQSHNFTSIEIPEGVTKIGMQAFAGAYNSTSLKTLKLPSTLVEMGNMAFQNNAGLEKIEIPGSLKTVPQNAFGGCTGVTELIINEGVEVLQGNAFYSFEKITEVKLPSTLTTIEGSVFGNWKSLTKIEIPEGITTIKNGTFSNCSALTEVKLPESLATIEGYSFSNCPALAQIVIPEGVTTVGGSAFYGCKSLFVFTKIAEQPAGWYMSQWGTDHWYNGTAGYCFGWTGENATYKFVTNADGVSYADVVTNVAISLPVPTRDGYVFGGWFANAEFTGDKIVGTYYNAAGATLYAKWYDFESWIASLDGKTRETGFYAALNEKSVYIAPANASYIGYVYFQFTPTESGTYYLDTTEYPGVYTMDGSYVSSNWNSSMGISTYELTAGVAYSIQISAYNYDPVEKEFAFIIRKM